MPEGVASSCQGPSAGVTDPIRILGGVVRARPSAAAKLVAGTGRCAGEYFRRRLSLKGMAEVCAVYIYPLILYDFPVLPLPRGHWVTLKQSLSKLLWKGRSPMARRQIYYQRPRNGGLRMPDLESHWLTERLAYLDRSLPRNTVWGQKGKVVFPHLKSNPEAEGC